MTQQTTLPPVTAEALDGITFDDQPSVAAEQTPEVNPEAPKPAEPAAPIETPAEAKKEVSLPSRYEDESDTQYDLRTKLFLTGQAKANAETPEEKSVLVQEMKRIREDLAKVNKKETTPQSVTVTDPAPTPSEQEDAVKIIKNLGFKTAEEINADIEKLINDRLQSQEVMARRSEQDSAIKEFYTARKDIFSDQSKRDNLEGYVLEMFKEQLPNMNKAQLARALDMSANYLYPKTSIARQSEAAQAKTDLLNISGSQGGDIKPSTVSDNSKQKLKDIGWSDADINSFEGK